MDIDRSESDLEDGEIREEAYEDISDCSLSGILPEDFSDTRDVKLSKKEAQKPLPTEDQTAEEEKYRLEALKSLLQNTDFLNENDESLREIDDLTDEEKYRIEAVKSLLRNTDFLSSEEKSPATLPRTKIRKRGKRGKGKKKGISQKRLKTEPIEYDNDRKPNILYLEETASLLSGLSEDVKKISKSLEDKKIINTPEIPNVDKENDSVDDIIDETPTVINSVKSNLRSWYPKTEFTLLDVSSAHSINLKRNYGDGDHKVKNSRNEIHQNREMESVTKNLPKTESVDKCAKPSEDKPSPQHEKLPKQEPFDDIESVMKNNDAKKLSHEPELELKPSVKIKNDVVSNKSTDFACDFRFKSNCEMSNLPQVTAPLKIQSLKWRRIPPKSVTPCSFRKFKPVSPIYNGKAFSYVRKLERYKINNIRSSKYTLRKTSLKVDKSKLKLNYNVKSRYSINRTNQFPKIDLKEFIIPLDDDQDDGSKEEKSSDAFPETVKNPPSEMVQNQVSLKTVANEPSSKTVSNQAEPEISSSLNIVDDKELLKIKDEPRDEEPNEEISITESPTTTTTDPFAHQEPYAELPTPLKCNTEGIQSEEVSSLKCDTNPRVSSQDLPENIEKKETDVLSEAEENLIEIRSKLLSSLDELDTSIKNNSQEKGKLLEMVKRLSLLKSAVTKCEEKIKTQKMKLAMSNSFTQSLYEGVMLRSKTCSRMKDLCAMAGRAIIGPQYRPPTDFETQIEDKQKTVDFSKYVQKPPIKK